MRSSSPTIFSWPDGRNERASKPDDVGPVPLSLMWLLMLLSALRGAFRGYLA